MRDSFKKYDTDNVFAKIIDGRIPSKTIYENEYVMVFHDINPIAKVHILVIPKVKYISMTEFVRDASSEEKLAFFEAINIVIETFKLEDGYKAIVNTKMHGGQEVPHFHMHIIGGERVSFASIAKHHS